MIQEVKPTKSQDLDAIRVLSHNELQARSFFNCTIPNTAEHHDRQGNTYGTHPRGGVAILLTPNFPDFKTATRMEGTAFSHAILQNRYYYHQQELNHPT